MQCTLQRSLEKYRKLLEAQPDADIRIKMLNGEEHRIKFIAPMSVCAINAVDVVTKNPPAHQNAKQGFTHHTLALPSISTIKYQATDFVEPELKMRVMEQLLDGMQREKPNENREEILARLEKTYTRYISKAYWYKLALR